MPSVHNTISVLQMVNGTLETVGLIDQIAPGEDIRSARFSGDLGFMVTFKKTDPLFVFDLSDPEQPEVKGELKIPGYSTYMHFMDKSHILSIGFDAEDHGSYALFQGVMLQVFDVTDITSPELIHKEVIGTRGTTSDATSDHLAFNYFKPKELLAIPMAVCEDGGSGSYGDVMTFNGLMVYQVTVEDGFAYQGGLPHAIPSSGYGWQNECQNWWTQSNSKVKRSVIMEDYVYSIAPDEVKVAALSDLDSPLASIPLQKP